MAGLLFQAIQVDSIDRRHALSRGVIGDGDVLLEACLVLREAGIHDEVAVRSAQAHIALVALDGDPCVRGNIPVAHEAHAPLRPAVRLDRFPTHQRRRQGLLGELEFQFPPLVQNRVAGDVAFMAPKFLARGVQKHLGRNEFDVVLLGQRQVFLHADVDEINLQFAGQFLLHAFKHGPHQLAGDALLCAQINQSRQPRRNGSLSGKRLGTDQKSHCQRSNQSYGRCHSANHVQAPLFTVTDPTASESCPTLRALPSHSGQIRVPSTWPGCLPWK